MKTTDIYRKARELAQMISETQEAMAYNDAKYIFEGNREAQALLNDYGLYRNAVQMKAEAGELSEEEFKKESTNLRAKMEEVKNNSIISDMFVAEQRLNNVVSTAFNIINATLFGDEGCGGDCGSCGGCH